MYFFWNFLMIFWRKSTVLCQIGSKSSKFKKKHQNTYQSFDSFGSLVERKLGSDWISRHLCRLVHPGAQFNRIVCHSFLFEFENYSHQNLLVAYTWNAWTFFMWNPRGDLGALQQRPSSRSPVWNRDYLLENTLIANTKCWNLQNDKYNFSWKLYGDPDAREPWHPWHMVVWIRESIISLRFCKF